ncbi:MAG TPA: glutaredoxin family protein [Dissulfurispiraceae bacterium]|nr:glutaredoxin family protein [Dissulfurispiraceae bacterium]
MEGQKKKVRLYSLSTCAACRKVKQFLDDNKVEYESIVVDTLDSGEQWLMSKELKKYNPSGSYPTVVVEEVVKGFDEPLLRQTLGIK